MQLAVLVENYLHFFVKFLSARRNRNIEISSQIDMPSDHAVLIETFFQNIGDFSTLASLLL